MEEKEIILSGRKYKALVSPDSQSGAYVIVGPPESLVDELGLPEPLATNLHNILYERGIFTYKDISRGNTALGVWQDALQIDAQRLVEKFAIFEREGAVE